jgi:hypothetical protein
LRTTVVIAGYNPNGPVARDLRIVSARLAYNNPVFGEMVMLLVHQAIYIPELATHNILSTMHQVHLNEM